MNMSEELQFAVMEAERLRKQLAEKDREINRLTETVSTLDRAEAQLRAELAKQDQLLHRAAEAIRETNRASGIDDMPRWHAAIDMLEKWLADYESQIVSTSSEVATDGDAQEER